ncbi:hypothetical protein [Desulfocurvus sp. DL9XJH121]
MKYVLVAGFILLGLVNLNLVRSALKTGRVQSRMLSIVRKESPTGFWTAILFQVLISAVCFAVAAYRLSYD